MKSNGKRNLTIFGVFLNLFAIGLIILAYNTSLSTLPMKAKIIYLCVAVPFELAFVNIIIYILWRKHKRYLENLNKPK